MKSIYCAKKDPAFREHITYLRGGMHSLNDMEN